MKKLLLLTFTYRPNADGVAEASTALASGMAAMGYQVTVVTSIVSGRHKSDFLPVIVEEFAITGFGFSEQAPPEEIARYQNFLREATFDVIICECFDAWPVQLAIPLLKHIQGVKILVSHGFSAHIWYPHSRFPWGLGAWGRSLLSCFSFPKKLRMFDHAVFLSERRDFGRFFDHTLAHLSAYPRHSVVPNGVVPFPTSENFANFRKIFGITTKLCLLCVANYSERKNQLLTVRAFQRAALPDATLVLIGSNFNTYSTKVKLACADAHSRVLFLENVSRDLICAAFLQSDIFILTAKEETQPIVLLEAMATGLPFISTNTGCVSDFDGGIMADGEKHIASAIYKLGSNPDLRRRLGDAGRSQVMRRYTREKMIAGYGTLLEQVVPAL